MFTTWKKTTACPRDKEKKTKQKRDNNFNPFKITKQDFKYIREETVKTKEQLGA